MISIRLKSLILAAALSAVSVPAFGQVDEGQALLAAGDARAAMVRFEKAVRRSPEDMEARLGLAQALIGLGEFDRAEKMAQLAYRRTQSPQSALVYAEALFGLERYGEAETALKAAGDHPDRASLAALIVAERALAAGDPEAALAGVRMASAHPHFGSYALLLGARAQYARGDYVRARRLVERILSSDEAAVPALQLSARLALRTGDHARARDIAQKIMSLDPGNVDAGAVLVEVALREGDSQAARAALAEIKPRQANDPRPAFLEALILLEEGNVAEAGIVTSSIKPWLENAPGGAVLLGQIKIATDKLAQAEQILRKRVAAAPDDHAARKLLIEVYDRTDRVSLGDQVLNDGLGRYPDNSVLTAFRVERLLARGEINEAAELLQGDNLSGEGLILTALGASADTTNAEDLAAIGKIVAAQAALKHRDFPGAIKLAQAASRRPGLAPIAGSIIAEATLSGGDRDKAKDLLDDLIAQYPDYLTAIEDRASLDAAPQALRYQLERAVDLGAQSAPIFRRLAIELYAFGAGDEAERRAREAFSAKGASLDDRLMETRILLAKGDQTAARAALKRALAAKSFEDEPLPLMVAKLLDRAGDRAEALTLATRLADGGGNAPATLYAAALARREGKLDEAIGLLDLGIHAHPDNKEIATQLLESLSQRDCASGTTRLEGSDDLRPFDSPALRARMLAACGKRAAAMDLLSASPAQLENFVAWAELAQDRAQKAALLGRLAPLAKRHPDNVPLLVLTSSIATELGQAETAEDAIAAGLAVVPNDPILLNNLAVLRMEGDPAGAVGLAERAYQGRPDLAEIVKTRIAALKAAGKIDESLQWERRLALME